MLVESLVNKTARTGGGFIKAAGTSGKRQIVDVITLAFGTDPVARWAYPNSQQYLEYFPNFIRLLGGRAFEAETAFYVNSFAAAALWLPPNVGADEAALAALFQNTVSKEIIDDLFAVFEQLRAFRPKEPHWYQPLAGVDPAQQRKGYGAMLLRHTLAVCDREGRPASLELTNPRNIAFYMRHGFELGGTVQAGSSPPIFALRRAPRVRTS